METLLNFIQTHKPYVDATHALSSAVNLIGWCLGFVLLIRAWRRNAIKSVTVGPVGFQLQEAAEEAAVAAARDWKAKVPRQRLDVQKIRRTVGQAFTPQVADKLFGKSILWVDDIPTNNELGVRALRKLQLEVEQATSTEQALSAMQRRHYDLIISDMGRGSNMRAGYELLNAIRSQGNQEPYFIFAGEDRPEFRQEAAQQGAQLSTNDMLELVDQVIKYLGR